MSASITDASGNPDLQAGAHPYQAKFGFDLNTVNDPVNGVVPDGSIKDLVISLPAGFIGNPNVAEACQSQDFNLLNCPANAQVGVVTVRAAVGAISAVDVPLYNLSTPPNRPARFGFNVLGVPVVAYASVRSDGDYGLDTNLDNISEGLPLVGSDITLWGVPADPSHDADRAIQGTCGAFGCTNGAASTLPLKSFLRNPTQCSGDAPTASMTMDSWGDPGAFQTVSAPIGTGSGWTGCSGLTYAPTITAQPDTKQADTPTGFTVDVTIPQSDDPTKLGTPDLRKAVVTLPPGLVISPGSADGLQGCTDDQVGMQSLADATCPDASKIGTISIDTPLLANPLEGNIYLGKPLPNQMFRIFLVASGSGVTLKLAGKINPDPATGQVTTVFDNNPQLPFSKLELNFKGGPRAPLATPDVCGNATTTSTLSPYGGPDATPSDVFDVVGCGTPQPFTPTFNAGSDNTTAGAFTSFTLAVQRSDGQQHLTTIGATLPPGLLGNVGSVPLCPDAQAAAGTCDASSQIGTTTVEAGSGSQPFSLGGKVYLTGPYKGGPFGLSIVVPALAGPFDLGTVVVRASITIDKTTAQLSVQSDPMPTILGGVPLRLRAVQVTMDRPSFMFNPTSCDPMTVNGSLGSLEGSALAVSSRFQAGGCANLPFTPTFTAETNGTLTFKQGASLKVHVGSGPGQANLKSVSVKLPKQLPSRLIPTINNACTLAQFDADYTKCPEDSYVGTVSATTPILPQPLTGPAYVVAPPNDVPQLKLKLFGQGIGQGVEVDLSGSIIIDSGGGRTLTTFNSVPDVPITSFDLNLPTGPHSILDAPTDDLCKGPITMDVRIVGQNNKWQDSTKPVAVADCPKIKAPKIVGSKATKRGLTLKLKPKYAGVITVSGNGLRAVRKTIVRPNVTYTFSLKLSAAGTRAIAKKGVLKTTPRIVFDPANGPKLIKSTAKSVKLKGT